MLSQCLLCSEAVRRHPAAVFDGSVLGKQLVLLLAMMPDVFDAWTLSALLLLFPLAIVVLRHVVGSRPL